MQLLVALCVLSLAAAADVSSPVRKVIDLLSQMKTQVEADAKEDEMAYEKFACWCKTNEKKKTEEVKVAEQTISSLQISIEGAISKVAQLKTEIEALEADIVEDQDSLRTATAVRDKERASFENMHGETTDIITTLQQAIDILAKVQLVQRSSDKKAHEQMFVQLKGVVSDMDSKLGRYRAVMQRDLWDVMDSMNEAFGDSAAPFLGRKRMSALAADRGKLQAGPNDLVGGVAGAKSYSARSSSIFGTLKAMMENFQKDLAEATKEEETRAAGFEKLRDLKMQEIAAGQAESKSKAQALADTQAQAAQDKRDLESTMEALSADQQLLVSLGKNCKENEAGYTERSAARTEELKALGEAINILSEDDARDLFGKTMSFLQTVSVDSHAVSEAKAVDQAMHRILKAARKHKDWALASLAVNMKLDAFTKVKEVMQKMVADLKAQQKAEDEKLSFCDRDIDSTEDEIKMKSQEKADLEGRSLGLENKIATFVTDIEALNEAIAEMQISLKRAGEDRKAENANFQQAISDQRAAINILGKAKARLEQYYSSKLFLLQAAAVQPGSAIAPPPPKSKNYEMSGGAGGVLQVLDKIISDATIDEAKILATEQNAQKMYEAMVKDLNANIEADRQTVTAKTQALEQAKGEKSETAGALLLNEEALTELRGLEKGLHLDCDWLIKYSDMRKQARQEEVEAIQEAMAILSGADFGKGE